jgi:hypothetical protein
MFEEGNEKEKDPIDSEYKESLENICDSVLDSIKESYQSGLEPWDIYAERKKQEMIENINNFRNRFAMGYEALMKELIFEKTGVNPDELSEEEEK